MWAFTVVIIAFGLTHAKSILVLFGYGTSDNQSLPPSTPAETAFTVERWSHSLSPHRSGCHSSDGDALARSEAIRWLVEIGLMAKPEG
jgi:hypothetical protein